jgi:hypothetical protein
MYYRFIQVRMETSFRINRYTNLLISDQHLLPVRMSLADTQPKDCIFYFRRWKSMVQWYESFKFIKDVCGSGLALMYKNIPITCWFQHHLTFLQVFDVVGNLIEQPRPVGMHFNLKSVILANQIPTNCFSIKHSKLAFLKECFIPS